MRALGRLILLAFAAVTGFVIYRAVQDSKADEELWSEATFDSNLEFKASDSLI
ncbi:MAG: DLW-39 family protein [Candidatus Nanopelagicales bacterium]|jgi:hypothetical protein